MSATLTIRNIDPQLKHELRKRAADHGVSMEQEARQILFDSIRGNDRRARKPSADELLAKYSRRPARSFDQKAASDELWRFVEDE